MPNERPSAIPSDDPEVQKALERLDLRDAMLAGLAAGANDLVQAAESLAHAARLTRMEKTVAIILLALSAISTVAVAFMTVFILHLANTNKENGSLVRDCVTPEGQCFQESQARTATAVANIVEANRVFVLCNRVTPRLDDAAFNRCVDEGFKRLPR